jgi:hypothetical protein
MSNFIDIAPYHISRNLNNTNITTHTHTHTHTL